MADIRILHNSRCSKSRTTKQILDDNNVDYAVVEYLKQTPSKTELEHILELLGFTPRELIRNGEAIYKELNLSDETLSDDALLDAMINHPILIERPIVIANGKAVIGRPPENVLDII